MDKRKLLKTFLIVDIFVISISLLILIFMLTPSSDQNEKPVNDLKEVSFEDKLQDIIYASTNLDIDSRIGKLFKKNELVKKIEERTSKEEGEVTVLIKDLKDGSEVVVGKERMYPPASTFKVYTSLLTLREVQEGRLSLDRSVMLTKGMLSQGAGTVYTVKDVGTTFTIRRLLKEILVESDNTCHSMLIGVLGREYIDSQVKEGLGLKDTSLGEFHTTNRDMAKVLEGVYRAELLNKEYSEYMLSLMKQSYSRDRIRVGLPPGTIVANKGGTLPENKHDVAIIFGEKGDYVLTIYTENIAEASAINTMVDISRIVWEYQSTKEY